MSLFVFKIITLVVRTLAKPMIAWVTHYKKIALMNKESEINKFWRNRLINIGNRVDHFNAYINKRILGLKYEHHKKLSDEKALERGAEFFSEFLVYSILISLPVIEYLRQNKINKENEFIKEKGLRRMNNDMIEIHNQNQKVNSTIEEILKIVKEIEEDTKDYKKIVHEAKPTEIKDLKTNEETDNIETLEGENLFL
jgi:hypothetical protein